MIRDENYFSVQGWMINRLGLKGIDLLLYAVIYGFSQDGDSEFKGSRNYLAEWCGCSMSTVARSLKSLQEDGLIEQVHHSADNKEVFYKAITNPSVKMTQASVKMTRASCQNDTSLVSKCYEPRVKMTRAIKDDNIADNIADKREAQTRPRAQFVPPTLEEIKQYSEEIGNQLVDPVSFFEYYSANGWIQGKNKKLRDWKAAFRLWIRREKSEKSAAADKDSSGTPIMIRTDYDMDRDDALDLLEGDP